MSGKARSVEKIDLKMCEALAQILQRSQYQKQYSMLTEFMLGEGREIFVGLSVPTRDELAALHRQLAATLCDTRPFASCQHCSDSTPCRGADRA